VNAFIDHYPTTANVLMLTVIFLGGYLLAVLKLRRLAALDWFMGLGGLSGWISTPHTIVRICIGAIVFVSGMTLMIIYFRRTKEGK
jgi:hypothetical protein